MAETRKIVLILGNGFDLDLGLKTSYKNFWESKFCPKDYPAPLIKHLNERWDDDLRNVRWYDMENELLNYYLSIKDLTRKPDVIDSNEMTFLKEVNPSYLSFGIKPSHQDAADSLLKKRYIIENPKRFPKLQIPYYNDMLESPIWRDKKAFELIRERLTSYLKEAEKKWKWRNSVAYAVLFAMKSSIESDNNKLNVYSFNYTSLPDPYKSTFSNSFYHVHGNCENNNIVIGTREFEKEDNNYDYLQKCITSDNPPQLGKSLYASDEVIIFGHSLGENDDSYFEDYFRRLLSEQQLDCKLTLFTKDSSSETNLKRAIQRLTNRRLTSLRNKITIRFYQTDRLYENSQLFRDFLSEYIKDYRFIEPIINNLKKADSES